MFLKLSVFHFRSAKCRCFLSEYGALFARVNNFLSLLSLLPRAALETMSHMSSQYEMMVVIPASLSASSEDRLGQMINNALFGRAPAHIVTEILGQSIKENRRCIN